MKIHGIALFATLLLAINSIAQWSNDPANPLLISNTTNLQINQQSRPDGSGGSYTFWMDSRANSLKYEVYGQHIDQNGNDLWEEGGRLIITDSKNIAFFSLYRYDDGKMIIGWYAEAGGIADPADKVWFQELNDEGQKVWSSDLEIAHETPIGSLSAGYYNKATVKRDALGFQVCMMIQTYGYDRIRMSRFSEDGVLMAPMNGIEIGPLDFGNVEMTSDGGTGAYVYYSTGNGLGAALMCNHVNENGAPLWSNWVSAAGPGGLGYQFSAIGDSNGLTLLWIENGNIYANRISPLGAAVWTSIVNICTFAGNQSNFAWTKKGDNYFVTWADGRPGLIGFSGIYAQKFDISGNVLWTTDGVQVANLNTYIPYPKILVDTEENVYISHQANANGYVVQKLDTNGNVQWDSDGNQIAVSAYAPNYYEHQLFQSGLNMLSVWITPKAGGGTDGVYISNFSQLPNPCPEDLNGDGFVNTVDLLLFISFYGCSSGCTDGDLNGDTVVNTVDLLIFISAYGTICP